MNAKINVVCYKSKILSNGEHPIMIRITKNQKRKYISLGISVNQRYWDDKNAQPTKDCPNRDIILKIILEKQMELQKQILEFQSSNKQYTASSLVDAIEKKPINDSVEDFYNYIINNLYDVGKIGNAQVYKYSLQSLKCFKKGKLDIPFNDIDVAWLNKYEQFLRKNGNSNNTMSVYFRTLRSVFNKAIEYKVIKKEYYPFDIYKISKFNVKTEKRAISKDAIHLIMNLEIPKGKHFLQLAKDIFIFSYLCAGINVIDIAYLTDVNIKNNTLTYHRHKTGNKITLPLKSEAIQLIEKYNHYSNKIGYLFPILDKNKYKTKLQQHNRIRKALACINKGLKKIAPMIGVDVNLTTYVARHSYATVLKKSGVNVALISETLGHTDLKTTQIYLDSFDNEQIAGAMENLL